MKKLLALALALTMLLGAASVASAEKVLRVSIAAVGDIFDPQYNNGASGSMDMAQFFEGLFLYDPNGVLVYGMAESHVLSDDQLVWTFTLREGVKWSDGQPLTAEDFVFSFRRLVNPELDSPNAYDFGGFFQNGLECAAGDKPLEELGVKAIDERTLEIILSAPCPFFDDILTGSSFFPIRSDVAKNDDEGKWSQNLDAVICNGPYKMVEYDNDSGFRLERNEYYYDPARQVPDAIEFKFIADENSALAAYTAGETDFSLQIPAEEVPRLKEEGLYHQMPRLGTFFLMPFTQRAPFDNPLVRKAFVYAVDVNYMATVVLNNRFLPAQSYVGPGFMGSGEGVDFFTEGGPLIDRSDYQANAEQAQAFLAEAGYPNGEGFPVIEYVFNDTVDNRAIAELLQNCWQTVLNIDVSVSPIEGQALNEIRKNGAFDITRQGWLADYNDALGMLNILTTTSGTNQGLYSNAKFDELFLKAQTTPDRAERMAILHEAEQILLDDMGVGPLLHYTFGFMYDPEKISGIYTSPAGQLYFTKAEIKD
jgi:oligopeptide transport system substrate-binding protein